MGKGGDARKKENKEPQEGSSVTPCAAMGCKVYSKQFGFCTEHYDHFKFGLIKKTGEPVPDYEKKFGHYMAMKARQGAKKVA